MLGESVSHGLELASTDKALLTKIIGDLPLLSDLCRADLLLYAPLRDGRALTLAHSQPHSFTHLWGTNRQEQVVTSKEFPTMLPALDHGARDGAVHTVTVNGTTAARQLYSVIGDSGETIAILSRDSFWLAHERHLRRSRVFQQAIDELIKMVLRGELDGAKSLSPFGENDGIVYVSADRRIQYMSGIASTLYRQLGYRDSLIGRRLSDIETVDAEMVAEAMAEMRCLEREAQQSGFTWTHKSVPLTYRPSQGFLGLWRRQVTDQPRLQGAFVLLHDETEELQRVAELEGKMAMLHEVHHRVKNNLQIIASLMRMQARRVEGDEARRALEESVKRISSVAVVHEFLSHSSSQETISLQEISRRIVYQIQESLLDPTKQVELRITSTDTIWLPAESATRCALVINELVQNAIEHGMAGRDTGLVHVNLEDDGSSVIITVIDNGSGLPEGFSVEAHANLGLQIVKSMVERDLRGRFTLESHDSTTLATVRFDKSL